MLNQTLNKFENIKLKLVFSFHFYIISMKQKIIYDDQSSFDQIELFQFQQLINQLENAKGDGTSLLTIMVPGNATQLNQMKQKLTREMGAAANIKDKINRQSV